MPRGRAVVLVLEVVSPLTQPCVAGGGRASRNLIKALLTMMPAYLTALGTPRRQPSPATLRQTRRRTARLEAGRFLHCLCATIHLSRLESKIFASPSRSSRAQGPSASRRCSGLIHSLGITMVAVPGAPPAAATGLLSSMPVQRGAGRAYTTHVSGLFAPAKRTRHGRRGDRDDRRPHRSRNAIGREWSPRTPASWLSTARST